LNRSNSLRFLIVDLQSCGDEVVTFLDYVTTLFFGVVAGIGKNIRNHCHFCQPPSAREAAPPCLRARRYRWIWPERGRAAN